MYEFEVLLKNGERTFIWGYSYENAVRRNPKLEDQIQMVLYEEFVD